MATTISHLYERIYEVLVDGAGTARTLGAGERFARLRTSKGDRTTISVRAKKTPLVEVRHLEFTPTESAHEMSSEHLYHVRLAVQRWYFLGHESDPSAVEATLIRMADDLMRSKAALCHPSNLLATEEAETTGIGGPALRFVRSRMQRPQELGNGADRLVGHIDEYDALFSYSPDA